MSVTPIQVFYSDISSALMLCPLNGFPLCGWLTETLDSFYYLMKVFLQLKKVLVSLRPKLQFRVHSNVTQFQILCQKSDENIFCETFVTRFHCFQNKNNRKRKQRITEMKENIIRLIVRLFSTFFFKWQKKSILILCSFFAYFSASLSHFL